MKTVEITEKRYLELVEAELELQALNSGGVDNWQWHWESRHDFLKFLRTECYDKEIIEKYCNEHQCDIDDLYFEDFAYIELSLEQWRREIKPEPCVE